jgi:hypothetical protein
MGIDFTSMKTTYEKTIKLAQYIKDIMYMQKYYLDIYHEINKVYIAGKWTTKKLSVESVRSYAMYIQPVEQVVHSSVQQKTEYNDIVLMTLSNSDAHIKNNTNKGAKYKYIHQFSSDPKGSIFNTEAIAEQYRDLYFILDNGINNNTIKESEFQASLLSCNESMVRIYLYALLFDSLKDMQFEDQYPVSLCLSSTDILRYIPARKAYIDLLDKRVGARHDWREELKVRYGRTIE